MSYSTLQLFLLGHPEVRLEGKVVAGFITKKAEAALYFLAMTGETQGRGKLAALFWPDMNDTASKKNLRTVLPNLRKLVGDYLIITRQAVTFNQDRPYWLDAAVFERAVAAAADAQQPDIPSLIEAVDLYRGDFLEGFHLGDTPEFDNWLLLQSERLRGLLVQGLQILSDYYLSQGEYAAGLRVTERWLAVEPWHEEAYYQRMLLLVYNEQWSLALKEYERCRQMLQEAFGVDPSAETAALYEQVRAELAGKSGAASHNLPRAMTPFFGRQEALYTLRTLLSGGQYPLLTIVGEGGIGKTRLALKVAEQARHEFKDGVWFVPLEEIVPPPGSPAEQVADLIAMAIGRALEISFRDEMRPADFVLQWLRQKHLLLVLDNFEHLLGATDFVLRLLRQRESRIHLLITSRARLTLQTEHVYQLDELPAPQPELPPERQARFASLQLFAERASRTGVPFVLEGENTAIARQICQLVGGLPLAIELAAALLGQKEGAEVIAAINQGVTDLALEMRDMPSRHRSLQAVFDYSWQSLPSRQQAVLAQCAIFAGPFPVEAAAAVAGANPDLLQRLLNQSLLRQADTEWCAMHPLTRRFCRQKLAARGEEPGAAQRHADYYLNWLQRFFAPQAWEMPLRRLAPFFADVQQAWETAIENNNFTLLADSSYAMAQFFDRLGLLKEAETMMNAALDRLCRQPQPDLESEVRLMASQVYFRFHTHKFPSMIEAGQYILAHTNHPPVRLRTIGNLSRALWSSGKLQEARQLLLEGQTIYQAEASPSYEMQAAYMRILQEMGITAMQAGEPDATRQRFEEALVLARSLHNRRYTGSILHSLSIYYQLQGRYYDSLQCVTDALHAYEQIGYQVGAAYAYNQTASVHLALGNYDQAMQQYEQTITLCRPMGMRLIETLSLLGMSCCYTQRQDFSLAIEYAQQALALYDKEDDALNVISTTLTILGKAYLAAEKWEEARRAFKQSLERWLVHEQKEGQIEPLAGLSRAMCQMGNYRRARELAAELLALLPEIFPYHENIWDLPWVYLMLYEVLYELQDPRAADILQQAKEMVLERATHIPDTEMRQHFLTQVAVHQRIGAAKSG